MAAHIQRGIAARDAGPPEKDEAPAGSTARGFRADQTNVVDIHSAACRQLEQCPTAFKALQARYERLGWTLYVLDGDSLIAGRWGMSKVLRNRSAALDFLHQVGGPAA